MSGVSPVRRALTRFARRKGAMIAAGFIVLLVLVALVPDLFAPYSPNVVDLSNSLSGPSSEHPLGTDRTGRDLLSRVIFATRISLLAAVVATALAVLAGSAIGLVSGYAGGKIDYLLMRLSDAVISIPPLIMAMAVIGVLGPGVVNAMIGLAIVFAPTFARLVRSQVMEVKEEMYVMSAVGLGLSHSRILGRHILPNILSPLIVQVFMTFGYAILAEGTLSFLGLSVQPPAASWGNMIDRAFDVIHTDGWQILIPGVAISTAIWAFNVVGDGLRDAFSVQ